jgi:hypothetical protein
MSECRCVQCQGFARADKAVRRLGDADAQALAHAWLFEVDGQLASDILFLASDIEARRQRMREAKP